MSGCRPDQLETQGRTQAETHGCAPGGGDADEGDDDYAAAVGKGEQRMAAAAVGAVGGQMSEAGWRALEVLHAPPLLRPHSPGFAAEVKENHGNFLRLA